MQPEACCCWKPAVFGGLLQHPKACCSSRRSVAAECLLGPTKPVQRPCFLSSDTSFCWLRGPLAALEVDNIFIPRTLHVLTCHVKGLTGRILVGKLLAHAAAKASSTCSCSNIRIPRKPYSKRRISDGYSVASPLRRDCGALSRSFVCHALIQSGASSRERCFLVET